jgi:hypothetical protein
MIVKRSEQRNVAETKRGEPGFVIQALLSFAFDHYSLEQCLHCTYSTRLRVVDVYTQESWKFTSARALSVLSFISEDANRVLTAALSLRLANEEVVSTKGSVPSGLHIR